MKQRSIVRSTLLLSAILASSIATAKPLKVYILAGQSNMVGHANKSTLPYIREDPATLALHNRLVDKDGKPIVHENVHVSLINEFGTRQGPLTTGFGAKQDSLGPELAFGATMGEKLQEPILIIKTAWGGKNLHTDFRSPSAGPYVFNPFQLDKYSKENKTTVEEMNAAKAKETGHFYRMMIEHVKMVLADPGKFHPAYNKQDGYEIAGFVWFQGWNDVVDGHTYQNRGAPGSYDAYTTVLRHFIRDVRKELDVPKMPFVIGVLGVNGSYLDGTQKDQRHIEFQKAMAAAADLPEFEGNVFAVHAGLYWDKLQGEADKKKWKIRAESTKLIKQGKLTSKDQAAYESKRLAEIHTPEEAIAFKGISNQPYHYLGSAKILSRIGEAFAEALIQKKGVPQQTHTIEMDGSKDPTAGKLEDVSAQPIPDKPAAGKVRGTEFKIEMAKLEDDSLVLRQGEGFASHLEEFEITFRGENIGNYAGKTFTVKPDQAPGFDITLAYSKKPGSISTSTRKRGYTMRLEFGTAKDGKLPGKIHLRLPDGSFVVGTFEAEIK